MSGDRDVTAVFQRRTISVTLYGYGHGTVTSDAGGLLCSAGACPITLTNPAPATVTLTAAPASDSFFAGWWGSGCSGTAATCTVTTDAARTVYATFAPKQYFVTVDALGAGTGSVTGAGQSCAFTATSRSCTIAVDDTTPATSVTLAVTTDSGSTFVSWGGACSGNGSCSLTMDQPREVTAVLESL
jgi:hypothetical protein